MSTEQNTEAFASALLRAVNTMPTINSKTARAAFSTTLDKAVYQPIEITRTGDRESVVMLSKRSYNALIALLQKAQLENDMDYILKEHVKTFEELADR